MLPSSYIASIPIEIKGPPGSVYATNPQVYTLLSPTVFSPRWSQSTERRIDGRNVFSSKIETEMFNGYGEHVAGLYAGMDLRKFY